MAKTERVQELPFLIRALWFFFIGWHMTLVWIGVAWLVNLTLIGLPLGVWMIERVPQLLTLKSTGGSYTYHKSGDVVYQNEPQIFFLFRIFYFIVFGWWVSLIWAIVAYLLCLSVIGLPFGVIMLNQLPFVTSLHRQ